MFEDLLLRALVTVFFLYCFSPYARRSSGAGFVSVQLGFLQLLMTQTWLNEVYIIGFLKVCSYLGTRFKAFELQVKNLKQDEW